MCYGGDNNGGFSGYNWWTNSTDGASDVEGTVTLFEVTLYSYLSGNPNWDVIGSDPDRPAASYEA